MWFVYRLVGVTGYGGPSPSYTYGNIVTYMINGPPSVEVYTKAATSVDTPAGASTLNGQVRFPAGTTINYYFEYSTTPYLDTGVTSTTIQSLLADNTTQSVSANVAGLPAGQYWFRVVAIQDPGTASQRYLYGSPLPFIIATTSSPSHAPSTAPTLMPTAPTGMPSTLPSVQPTAPTGLPSQSPTLLPTSPTGMPSKSPTRLPTGKTGAKGLTIS